MLGAVAENIRSIPQPQRVLDTGSGEKQEKGQRRACLALETRLLLMSTKSNRMSSRVGSVEARKFATRSNRVVCSFVSLSREAALW